MTAASFLVVLALNGILAHLAALLTDAGAAKEVALSALVAVGISAIVGRLISGFLLDRFFAPHLSAILFLVPLLAVAVILSGATTPPLVTLAAVCLGFSYGEVYGYIFAVFTIGSGIGPYLLGLSFDRTGNYRLGVTAASAVLVVASGLMVLLGPYRYPADARGREAVSEGKLVAEAG